MDARQVNSMAVHDDRPDAEGVYHDGSGDSPGSDSDISPALNPGADGYQQGDDGPALEKRATSVSAASIPETYPEGGLQAWLVVLGSWFAMFASLGLMNTLAIFQAYTLSHQLRDYDEGTVGWVFSIYTFLAFFCGVYIGPVFDKYGPKWLVIAGSICTVVGVLTMSFCYGE